MENRRLRRFARHLLQATPSAEAVSRPTVVAVADARVYTLAEVAEHRTRKSAWVAINNEVFDFTS